MSTQNPKPESEPDVTAPAATGAGSDTPFLSVPPLNHQLPTDPAGAAGSHRVGPYVVLGELGRGGMGVVYRAEDAALKREVALKVMLPQFAANPQAKARFVREARAQAKVEHEHVAVIHHVAEHDGVPYLVMPLLKGMTLHAALRGNPRPPLPEVLRIAREVAEGLAAAHEQGLVHRDIKPANIWLEGKKLRVRVLDFGLARASDAAEGAGDDGPVTREGAVVGTPAYMSPEQGRGLPVDARTDLFSVGVMLYQMTTGELPFKGATTLAVLTSLAVDHPPPPNQKNPSLPVPLSDLVMRLLSKDPAGRPPSAEALAEELRAIEVWLTNMVRVMTFDAPPLLQVTPVGPDPFAELDATEASASDSPARAGSVGDRSSATRGGFAAWAAAVAAVLAVGGLGWFVVQKFGPKNPVPDAAREDPLPKPPPKKDFPPVFPLPKFPVPQAPDPAARKALEAVLAHMNVTVRLPSGTIQEFKKGTSLPADPLEVVALTTDNAPKPADFAATILAALAGQKWLTTFEDPHQTVHWSEADLERLSALPAAKSLTRFWTGLDLTPKTVELMRKFPALIPQGLLAGEADDDTFLAFVKLGQPIKSLIVRDLGKAVGLTEKGWAALAILPAVELILHRPTRLGPDGCAAITRMPNLTHLIIQNGELDAAGMEALAGCPKLVSLNLTRTKFLPGAAKHLAGFKSVSTLLLVSCGEITDDDVPHLAAMTTLRNLDASGTKITEAGVAKLRTALPRCRIAAVGKVFEPTDAHWREAKRFLDRSGFTVAIKAADGKLVPIKAAADLPAEPFTLVEVMTTAHNLTDDDLKLLEATPTLTRVSATAAPITVAGLRSLGASKDTLINLYLNACAFADDGLAVIAGFPKLTGAHFGGTKITDAGLKHLAGHPAFAALSLDGCTGVTDAGLNHLAAMPALKNLVLDGTGVSDAGIETLAGMTGLKHLHLHRTRVTAAGLEKLRAALAGCKIQWEAPDRAVATALLARTGTVVVVTTPDGKRVTAKAATDLPVGLFTLVVVTAAGPKFTDDDLKLLEATPTLVEFNAAGSPVTDAGFRSLLASKATLAVVYAHKLPLTDESLRTAAELANLESLNINGTRVTDAGLKHLAGLARLRTLSVGQTAVTDAGLAHLAALPALRTLHLHDTAVSDAGVEALAALKNLGELTLRNTRVTAAGVEQLRAALPKCKILWEPAGEKKP